MKDYTKTAHFASDCEPRTSMRITRTHDGDVCLSIYGDGEMRISMSGSIMDSHKKVKIVKLFDQIIDALNTEE